MLPRQMPPNEQPMYFPQQGSYPNQMAGMQQQMIYPNQMTEMEQQRSFPNQMMGMQQQRFFPNQMMGMQQQRSFPNQMMGMSPMQLPQKKKGFLGNLFRRNQQTPPYQGFPMNRQAGFPPRAVNNPPQFSQYQPQTSVPMMNPSNDPGVRMSRSGTSQAIGTAAGKSTGGIGTFFSNLLSDPSSMMGNVEKVVKVAQTVGPVVQQYSPFIKNFPNLTKMLSSLPKKEPDVIPVSSVDVKPEETVNTGVKENKNLNKQKKNEIIEEQTIVKTRDTTNKPKLYV